MHASISSASPTRSGASGSTSGPPIPRFRQLIANRLGWLDALDFVTPQLPRLRAFADAVRRDGFTHVVLLGMGGSSLAPEVLRQVLGARRSRPRVSRARLGRSRCGSRGDGPRATTSLFILASKSGSTIEPNVMAAEAQRRVIAAGHADWGTRFIAITDEDTALHRRATADGFRDVFVNPSDIGGRYSALSLFGMVPAALMGLDLDALLARRARHGARPAGSTDASENPGPRARRGHGAPAPRSDATS